MRWSPRPTAELDGWNIPPGQWRCAASALRTDLRRAHPARYLARFPACVQNHPHRRSSVRYKLHSHPAPYLHPQMQQCCGWNRTKAGYPAAHRQTGFSMLRSAVGSRFSWKGTAGRNPADTGT